MVSTAPDTSVQHLRKEAPWALAYFAAFLLYLCGTLESEWRHWLSLVILPAALVYWRRSRRWGAPAVRQVLAAFGLQTATLRNDLLWAFLLGIGLSWLQVYLSRDSQRMVLALQSGKLLYLWPAAFALMLVTAGFTEEFFFRGLLQTRLQQWLGSNAVAVLLTALLFGLYHLPYAYFHPRWPSHGNLAEAFALAFGQGMPVGLILGTLYVRSQNNLLACVLVHAMINALPAALLLEKMWNLE